ncbi:MAG: SpoIIE family protein phosphatase [Bacteroidales bacterium]|nr:SpoIIE family protein phosphatase [Bacteroidales bacterium]
MAKVILCFVICISITLGLKATDTPFLPPHDNPELVYDRVDSLKNELLNNKLNTSKQYKITNQIIKQNYILFNHLKSLNKIDSAINFLLEIEHYNETLNDSKQKIDNYEKLAYEYSWIGNIDAYIVFANKLKDLSTKLNYPQKIMIANLYAGVGHQLLGNHNVAHEHFKRGLITAKSINDSVYIARLCYRIAEICMDKYNNADSAFYYAELAAKYNLIEIHKNYLYTELYIHFDFLNKADSLIKHHLVKDFENNKMYPKSELYYLQALLLKKNGQYKQGIHLAQKGYEYSLNYHVLHCAILNLELLSELYDSMDDKNKAFEYLKLLNYLEDSLHRDTHRKSYHQFKDKQDQKNRLFSDQLLAKQKLEITHKNLLMYSTFIIMVLLISLGIVTWRAFLRKKRANDELTTQKQSTDKAYSQVELKNKEIIDSINYAQRIQLATLPSSEQFEKYIPNSFILFNPKDIVAGDFYWLEHLKSRTLLAVCDCTNHGVAGAMIAFVCNTILNRCIWEFGLTDPASILNKTRELAIKEFRNSDNKEQDGLKIALCSIKNNILSFAGAANPLWIVRKNSNIIEELKPDKYPIGQFITNKRYKSTITHLASGDCIYMFTDGFLNQFGGPNDKKFKTSNFKKLILSIKDESMEDQRNILNQTLNGWKGNGNQLDDICVIGMQID